jgi:hypothetical protein
MDIMTLLTNTVVTLQTVLRRMTGEPRHEPRGSLDRWNRCGPHNASLMHYAVLVNRVGLIRYLLRHGAPVDPRDDHGRTPLSWACQYGLLDIVTELVDHGADVNALDDASTPPLLWLIQAGERRTGNLEATEAFLRSRGATTRGTMRRWLNAWQR